MDQKSLKQLNQMREEQALLKEANQVQTNAAQSSEEIYIKCLNNLLKQ
jgi:hypothetical protein